MLPSCIHKTLDHNIMSNLPIMHTRVTYISDYQSITQGIHKSKATYRPLPIPMLLVHSGFMMTNHDSLMRPRLSLDHTCHLEFPTTLVGYCLLTHIESNNVGPHLPYSRRPHYHCFDILTSLLSSSPSALL